MIALFTFTIFTIPVLASGYCWKPGTSPFYGPPKIERNLDSDSDGRVRVSWSEVFNDGPECTDVDFLIMIQPKADPSTYTLSDFTRKGQRSATLKLADSNADYVFQVIAREDKGSEHGIDYKYSLMVQSYANPAETGVFSNVRGQSSAAVDGVEGVPARPSADNRRRVRQQGQGNRRQRPTSTRRPSPRPTTTTRRTTTTPRTTTTTTTARPYVRSTTTAYPTYYQELYAPEETGITFEEVQLASALDGAGADDPWYIYECLPFLKNIEGFPENTGTNSSKKHNKALLEFVKHANTQPMKMVQEFVSTKKNLDDGECSSNGDLESRGGNKGQGFLSKCYTGRKCCPTPWLTECDDKDVCYTNYFACDGGRCIPEAWVNDDWPDCFDGSDEEGDTGATKDATLPQQLVCIQCAGVVLSAGFICRETSELTRDCLETTMGKGGACNQCVDMYLNLP